MAFFKFRFPGQDDQAHHNNDSPHESLEALRKRVKHRLIGSGVLVLIAVIGFPLVFDTQPRPVGLDIPSIFQIKRRRLPMWRPRRSKSDKRAILVDKNQDQGNDSSSSQNPSKGADLAKSSQDNVVAGSSSNASGSAGATPLAPSPSALATPTPVTAPAQTSTPSALTASGSSKSSANSPANASSASSRSSESKSAPVNTRATLDAKEEIVPPSKTQSSNSKTTSSETTSTQKDDRFCHSSGCLLG
jgi:DedD protein